jgi:hypothetical protein
MKSKSQFATGVLLGGLMGSTVVALPLLFFHLRDPVKQPAVAYKSEDIDIAKIIVERESHTGLYDNLTVSFLGGKKGEIRYLADIKYGTRDSAKVVRLGTLDRIVAGNAIQDVLSKTSRDEFLLEPLVARTKIMAKLPKTVVGFHIYMSSLPENSGKFKNELRSTSGN